MTMTPHARVLCALDHREPDRVPLALWGSWYGVTDPLYLATMQELGWDPCRRSGRTSSTRSTTTTTGC